MYEPPHRLEHYVNDGPTILEDTFTRQAQQYVEDFSFSVLRNYTAGIVDDVNSHDNPLRMSTLGKPAVLQLLKFPHIKQELESLGYVVDHPPFDERRNFMFHLGDMFEAWFKYLLCRSGVEIVEPPNNGERQWTFNLWGVSGHCDIIAYVKGIDTYFMIECKSQNHYSSRIFATDPWGFRPEYVTQVSLYAHAFRTTQLPAGEGQGGVIPVVVTLNTDTRALTYTYISLEMQTQAINRAKKCVEIIPTITSFADYKGKIIPPPGEEITYYGKVVSEYLKVPASMKFCPCLELFYLLDENYYQAGKRMKKVQTVGYRLPDNNSDDVRLVTNYQDPSVVVARN